MQIKTRAPAPGWTDLRVIEKLRVAYDVVYDTSLSYEY